MPVFLWLLILIVTFARNMEQQRKILNNEESSTQPANKIADWLKVLEQTHLGRTEDKQVIERLRAYYHQNLIISYGVFKGRNCDIEIKS